MLILLFEALQKLENGIDGKPQITIKIEQHNIIVKAEWPGGWAYEQQLNIVHLVQNPELEKSALKFFSIDANREYDLHFNS